MKAKTIDEYVGTLLPQEREKFKDLIAECRQREKELKINKEKSRQTNEKLAETWKRLFSGLSALCGNLDSLNKDSTGNKAGSR